MMKKFNNIVRVLLVLLISFSVLSPIGVQAKDAETLGDLRQIYESVLAEKQEYDRKSDQAKQEIASKEAAIKQAEKDLNAAEKEEKETSEKIDESNAKIESLKKESEKVLLYMQQMQSKNAYVEYVSQSASMTELITRIEAVKQVTDHIQSTVDNLEKEIKKNEQLKIDLENKQKQLTNKITNFEEKVKTLYANAEDYDEFSLSLDTKVEIAKKNYEANKQICLKNIGKADDSVLLSSCSKVPYNGAWMNPLKYGVVTSKMGYRTHPVTGVRYKFHDGIDIGGNGEGTPVYAAAAGRVVAKVNRASCGGNMLFIDVTVNGKNYTTYYYHLLRFNVNVGDVVTQDTVIGYVGGGAGTPYDYCSTGAHLHYGAQTGWYNTGRGLVRSNIIVPPGMNNQKGYRFTSRMDIYNP